MGAPASRRTSLALAGVALGDVLAVAPPYSAYTYLAIAVAVASFGVLAFSRPGRVSLRAVIVCGAIALLAAALAPYRFSRDVAAYTDYGAMVVRHHASPYVAVPSAFPNEPAYRAMNPSFHGVVSVYGPLFTAISAGGVALAGRSLLAARLFFQLLEALAVAAAGWLVWRRTRDPIALACVALNPVLVVSVVNGGHNDGLVGVAVLSGLLLASRGRTAWGGVAFALGALVKVTALLPAAAIAAWLWRRSARDAAVFAVPAAAVTIAGFAGAGGLHAVRALRSVSLLVSYPSFWTWIRGHAGAADVRAWSAALVLVVAVLGVLPRSRRQGPDDAAAASVAAYLFAAAYVLPWYGAWAIPVSAARRRERDHALVLGFTALLLLAYFPLTFHVAEAARSVRDGFVHAMKVLELVGMAAVVAWGYRRRGGDAE